MRIKKLFETGEIRRMTLKLKEGCNPEILRNYGFKRASEYFGKALWCGDGSGHSYMRDWYIKFLTYTPEEIEELEAEGEFSPIYKGDNIKYTEDDIPMVEMIFRIGDDNTLYIDCAPAYSYHISELDIVADTIFDLVTDGIVEKV